MSKTGKADIDPQRISTDIDKIAEFTESEESGVIDRPTFSGTWRQARDYVITRAEAAGATARVDAFGNLHLHRPDVSAAGTDTLRWLCGSHLDSVPSGGRFDGVMGVVAALEILRACPDLPLEVVVFAEEEGTTFGLGLLGSRAWTGEVSVQLLSTLRNRKGETYIDAGAAHGVDPSRMQEDVLDPASYFGIIEIHAEQGCTLWNGSDPVAAVTRINGRKELHVTLSGRNNHAGSTRMQDRRDALAGTAEAVLEIERTAKELDAQYPHTVMTVGRLVVSPNAMTVIPGAVSFVVDFRAQEIHTLEEGERIVRRTIEAIARRRHLEVSFSVPENVPPTPLDTDLTGRLHDAAQRLGYRLPAIPSGALHDAAKIAGVMPAAMLFVASRDGISHDPDEYSRTEDIARAAEIAAEAFRSR